MCFSFHHPSLQRNRLDEQRETRSTRVWSSVRVNNLTSFPKSSSDEQYFFEERLPSGTRCADEVDPGWHNTAGVGATVPLQAVLAREDLSSERPNVPAANVVEFDGDGGRSSGG